MRMQQIARAFDSSHYVQPRLKPYYQHGYGSKSIGEPDWRPHPRNALSQPDTQQFTKMGSGLDWFLDIKSSSSSLARRDKLQPVQENANTDNNVTRESEHVSTKMPLTRQESSSTTKRLTLPRNDDDEDDRYYYMKPFELTLRRAVGAKKKVYCKRNGLLAASLGDKSYQVPEYSRDFHKQGSTRPVISFGGITRCIPDTFIPLQDLPLKPRPTFESRRKALEKAHDITEVVALDTWKPAPSLIASFQLPLIASHLLH